MPLLIDFKAGDKIIVNGAVLENAGSNSKILVHNQAAILRGREVLSEEDALTPAARAYFALQCAYIFPMERERYLGEFEVFLNDFLTAAPSASDIGAEIRQAIEKGNLYKALKATHKLINKERDIFKSLEAGVAKAAGALEADPDADADASSPATASGSEREMPEDQS